MSTQRTYLEMLKDPLWQRKRLEIMERDNFTCRRCRSADKMLNVHHSYYKRGAAPWDYPNESLETLCEKCHERLEELLLSLRQEAHKMSLQTLAGLVADVTGNRPITLPPALEEMANLRQSEMSREIVADCEHCGCPLTSDAFQLLHNLSDHSDGRWDWLHILPISIFPLLMELIEEAGRFAVAKLAGGGK